MGVRAISQGQEGKKSGRQSVARSCPACAGNGCTVKNINSMTLGSSLAEGRDVVLIVDYGLVVKWKIVI